ncbi:MAG: hypothetical protein SVM80_08510 [Halobacteriota archaeon]|nr:hypothetical protein [Halobacteriota archaeon]
MKGYDDLSQNNRMPRMERAGLIGSLIASLFLIAFSIFSLMIDLALEFDMTGILIDLVFLIIGIFAGFFSVRMFGKTMYYERMADYAFENGVYRRMEPVLRKVAEVEVDISDLETKISVIDKKVQAILDEQIKAQEGPEVERMIISGTSTAFAIKTIFMVIITMSGFFYMIEFPFGMAHYTTLVFYILWWLFISSEFDLYSKTTSWLVLCIPILLVPVGIMILDIVYFEITEVIGLFFVGMGLYALLYYLYALYETKGTLPFSSLDIEDLRESVETNQEGYQNEMMGLDLRVSVKSHEDNPKKIGFMRGLFGNMGRNLADFFGLRRREE